MPRYRYRYLTRWEKVKRTLSWCLTLFLILFIVDIAYLAFIWPDWKAYQSGPVGKSNFIRQYQQDRKIQRGWPRLKWKPVSINQISKNMLRAAIVAEDAGFYWHSGIDLEAFQSAMETNFEKGRFVYGGSTISQQTVKNVFLSQSRDPLRKWHELVLTLAMERYLTKTRILALYLNVAEFGRGIYGVEAAARHYWGVSASRLTRQQAIQLAASLPAPGSHNPATRTRFFKSRVRKINRYF